MLKSSLSLTYIMLALTFILVLAITIRDYKKDVRDTEVTVTFDDKQYTELLKQHGIPEKQANIQSQILKHLFVVKLAKPQDKIRFSLPDKKIKKSIFGNGLSAGTILLVVFYFLLFGSFSYSKL